MSKKNVKSVTDVTRAEARVKAQRAYERREKIRNIAKWGTGLVAIVLPILMGIFYIISEYRYEKEIYSSWSLADKSSTLSEKLIHMDNFITVLDQPSFRGKHNALILKTPDNSFDANFKALESLHKRLLEINDMEVSSFEYQVALQQITQQEFGEADKMVNVFKGVWLKDNYIFLWDWLMRLSFIFIAVLSLISLGLWLINP